MLLAIFRCEVLGAGIGSSFPFLAPTQGQQALENVDADLLPQTPGSRDAEDNVLHRHLLILEEGVDCLHSETASVNISDHFLPVFLESEVGEARGEGL